MINYSLKGCFNVCTNFASGLRLYAEYLSQPTYKYNYALLFL